MILSDQTIMELINNRAMSIEPFREDRLTPNGYDFSIVDTVVLPPNGGLQLESLETVSLPAYVGAIMLLRSTYTRKGVFGSFGFVDAGFRGKIRFFVKNLGEEQVEIVKDKGVFQMIFINLDKAAAKTYELRSGHYQNQGIKS
ncbi:MAG: hypothetical protein QXN66_03495 [Thermoplasmatales archaeon]